jgi:LPS-assembly protein
MRFYDAPASDCGMAYELLNSVPDPRPNDPDQMQIPPPGQTRVRLPRRLALLACLLASTHLATAAEVDETWRFCPPHEPSPLLHPAGADDDTVRMSADTASTQDGIYTLEGNAVVSRGLSQLRGETLIYNESESSVEAIDNVNYSSPDLVASGKRGKVFTETDSGTLDDIEYTLPGRHGRGTASVIHLDDRQHQRLEQTSYTTCPPGNRDWLLYADEVTLDHTDGTGVAEHARFSLRGVPVLYTPWITFPIDDRRKTGLLIPRFGHSQESGYEVSAPFYWNLAPNYDATITPRVMSRRGLMLGGEFRYLTNYGSAELGGEYLPSDNEYDDRDRSLVSLQHRGHPIQRMDTRINAAHVSDKDYFTDLGDDLVSSSKTHLRREAEIAYHGHGWTTDARVLDFQTVDPTISSKDRPYKQLPRLRFNAAPRQKLLGMRFSLDSELSEFDRDNSVTGTRVDLQPRITLPMHSAAWFVEPSASLRSTLYRLDDTDPGDEEHPNRTTPVFSVDSGAFFDRQFRFGQADYVQTLEPRLFYLLVPNRGQDDLPVFDTGDYDFNFWQLFTENRFTGPDRMGDANQLAMALTSRILDPATGVQRVSASLGNLFYFRDRKVALPGEVVQTDDSSDILGEVKVALGTHWNAGSEIHWDPGETHTSRYDALLQYRVHDRKLINLSYRYRRDILQQTDVSFLWPLTDTWHVIGRWNYSLDDDQTLEGLAGVGYESCCWNVQLVGRSYVNDEDGDRNTAIFLQVELKGLTSLGNQVDSLLERGILGYQESY